MNCCFRSKHPNPVTVAPGGTFAYACELTVKHPGPFEAELVIYLEDNGSRAQFLTVRGVASGEADDDKDKSPRP